MTLYHVTSRTNRGSIAIEGLDPRYATHGRRAVWLVARSNVAWALAHTAAKPGRGRVADLVVYRCEVPRSALTRFRRGIWWSTRVVRPVCVEPSSVYTDAYPS